MIYITGDKHANYKDVLFFCYQNNTSKEDTLIILGDAGINYFLDLRDYLLKESLANYSITFFCIHGNHEERPNLIPTYKTKEFHEGTVYYEKRFPNILFAKDTEIYDFNGLKTFVIGGAYSIDKEYRLMRGYNWYSSEQPDNKTKQRAIKVLNNNKVDIILSHTCPYSYLPREAFIPGFEKKEVDNSTEYFLDMIEKNYDYQKWYCGHFHIDKEIDKIEFMSNNIKEFEKKLILKKD